MPDGIDAILSSARSKPDTAWKQHLTRGESGLHQTVANAITVLGNDSDLAGLMAYDDFAHCITMMRAPPLPYPGARALPGPYPRPTCDADVTMIQGYLQREHGLRVGENVARQAIHAEAELRRFHPVRDWLASLKWDGASRIESWLHIAFGAPRDSYHDSIGMKVLFAAVRRVFKPGCKFDHVLVLEGLQGKGKSRACAALFGQQWFKDDLSHDLSDKDAQQGMAGKWGVELAELNVLVRSTSGAAKGFFSRQVDHFRPSYGRSFVERPRQCIFIGTTNERDYLTDTTGNRRYWPVACDRAEVAWIEENRDQLWAEAVATEAGEALWLDESDVADKAVQLQAERVAEDPWASRIEEWLRNPERIGKEVFIADVLGGLGVPSERMTVKDQRRAGSLMRELGWESVSEWDSVAKRTKRRWAPKPPDPCLTDTAFVRNGMP